jgi:putative oxidoreductase
MTTTTAPPSTSPSFPMKLRTLQQHWLGWQEDLLTRDVALLLVRLSLAWIFVYHGSETLFGAFHGAGIHGQAQYFAHTAHLHPATLFAVLNGITEFFGGIAIGVGLLSRLSALGLVVDMVLAMITVTVANGITDSASGSGYELNLALAALAAGIMLLGPGRIALDRGLRTALHLPS